MSIAYIYGTSGRPLQEAISTTMRTLTLIRHAKSSWDDPTLRDFDRPLNARGFRDAGRMGEVFRDKLPPIELIVTSPALRARTTATMLAEALDYPMDRIASDERLYDAPLTTLREIVSNLDNRYGHVALVAHNPGLERLSGYLGGDVDRMPTCAAVTLEFEVDDWQAVGARAGRLVAFEYPKKYRR